MNKAFDVMMGVIHVSTYAKLSERATFLTP